MKGGSMASRKVSAMVEEFKNFALKGNVVDLAIGVIIGAAFGKIVSALVDGVIMPVIGLLVGGINFSQLAITLKAAEIAADGKEIPYGLFIGEVVNFLIIALALYIFIVKFIGMIVKSKEAAPPAPTKDQELLAEIRDLLKK